MELTWAPRIKQYNVQKKHLANLFLKINIAKKKKTISAQAISIIANLAEESDNNNIVIPKTKNAEKKVLI